MKNKKNQKGFTLIEILVVIGIIAILATVVLVAINPARQFAQGRESQRVSNVNAILNAIGQRMADNKGIFEGGALACPPLNAASSSIMVGATDAPLTWPITGITVHAAPAIAINLSCLQPTYMPALPMDPTIGGGANSNYTGYEVSKDANGRITVCAPASEAETAIPATTLNCITR